MKRIPFLLILLAGFGTAYSCPACKKQQPGILKGITHGSGPQSGWDYLIIAVAAVIVLATLFFSVKYLLSPGEKSENHIKRMALNYE
ncbi:hypothetical protein [Chitinophaga sp. GbtcB8]|uniref:hypothetical protein n=1 Tax=Chitinophaga sp. GbtcB8 TaxID=2824753 RepID=UPI001C3045AF|nr:hypothetical protein [Chitinophaga sp. GbtcB8]